MSKQNTKAQTDAGKEVGLEVNLEKTKCVLVSWYKSAGEAHNVKVANRSREKVGELKYLENIRT
jgi:hypothetical protein